MDDQEIPHGQDVPEAPPPQEGETPARDTAAETPYVESQPEDPGAASHTFTPWPHRRQTSAAHPLVASPVSRQRLARLRAAIDRELLGPIAAIPERARDQFSRDVGDLRRLGTALRDERLEPLAQRVDQVGERIRTTLTPRPRAPHTTPERHAPAAAPRADMHRDVSRPTRSRPIVSRQLLPPLPEWTFARPQSRVPEAREREMRPREFRLPEWPHFPTRPPRPARGVVPSPNATRRLRDPRKRMLLVSSLVVLLSMAISLLIPGLAAASAMADYNSLKALGEQAVQHLFAAKDDLSGLTTLAGKASGSSTTTSLGSCSTTGASATPSPATSPTAGSTSGGKTSSSSSSANTSGSALTAALDPKAFTAAESELRAAQKDFQTLQTRLNRPDWVIATAASLPGLETKLRSIGALVEVGSDATALGIEVIDAALPIVTRLHGASSLAGDTELLTQSDLTHIQKAAADAQDKLADIQAKLGAVDLSDLPLCASQRSEITQVETMLPQVRSTLAQGSQLLGAAGWLIGVDAPRNFLVQTLDPSEMRPTGGFTGNYGVLTIQNGKLSPFTLYNVNDIDYGLRTNGWILGKRPPSQYSWWPFANWGLRDSNLSADFPTTAKLVEQVFANEGGGNVDGVIQISPQAIANVLLVTGPIYVPVFNDTVTAANLVDKIHFYEEDPAGIAIQQKLFPDDHTHSLRKRFTQTVVQLLQTKVKSLPISDQLKVGKQFVSDLQAKNVQIYVNNQQIEDVLTQLQASGAVETTPGIDGYFLTQANVSVAKSTPYVQMTQKDTVTLDNDGGASHRLAITFFNNPTGPVYGFLTYHDYVRIYVPPQAQLKRASGFDSGTPMCWAPSPSYSTKPAQFAGLPDCGTYPYPSGALVCPAGAYGPGPSAYTVFGGDPSLPQPLDNIGGPTSTSSDIANRAMWGGYVVVPPYCTATLSFTYYVPGVAAPANAVPAMASPYTMLLQRQGSTDYKVNVTIQPSPAMAANGMKTAQYSAQVDANTAFTLGNPNPRSAADLFGLGQYGKLFGLSSG